MSRELDGYRDNVESLLEFMNGRHLMCIQDVVKYTGRNRATVEKLYGFNNNYITVEKLARQMCK